MQDNGGKPISHYVVEKKDKKSGKWTPVSKYCRTPECDVTGLDDGEEYEFRVAAVNDQGQSEPLLTTKPIIAKHPFGTALLFILANTWSPEAPAAAEIHLHVSPCPATASVCTAGTLARGLYVSYPCSA